MSNQSMAEQSVLSVLGNGTVAKIAFSAGGYRIDSSVFGIVRQAILDGDVEVDFWKAGNDAVRKFGLSAKAVYSFAPNRLLTPFLNTQNAYEEALVLHECTHAACDVMGYRSMKHKTSEAMAYIAQCMYVLLKVKLPNEVSELDNGDILTMISGFDRQDEKDIFGRALFVAKSMIFGELDRAALDSFIGDLEKVIAAHPTYSAIAEQFVTCDPLPEAG